jgi:hypothetical protein
VDGIYCYRFFLNVSEGQKTLIKLAETNPPPYFVDYFIVRNSEHPRQQGHRRIPLHPSQMYSDQHILNYIFLIVGGNTIFAKFATKDDPQEWR